MYKISPEWFLKERNSIKNNYFYQQFETLHFIPYPYKAEISSSGIQT